MFNISSLFISIGAFIIAIGILVTFHEFGHFWVARRLGVKVLRFSVGFGKPLWTFRDKQQTEYVIAAIPLGGYVKMLDEREGPVAEEEKSYAFNLKPVWSRFAIVLAGPLFNFLFAILVYWVLYIHGISAWVPQIGEIRQDSIAAHAGLSAGAEITQVDGVSTVTWPSVVKQMMKRLGDNDTLEIQAKKAGKVSSYTLDLSHWELKGKKPDLLFALGIEPYQPPTPPIVTDVLDEGPAGVAGVLPGDKILTVNGKPIDSWKAFTDVVRKSIGKTVYLTLQRGKASKQVSFIPVTKESDNGEKIGFAGLVTKIAKMPPEFTRKERLGPLAALGTAIQKTSDFIGISFKVVGKMLVGKIGLQNLSGPLTIAQGAGASASIGFEYYLGFLALISISLGVLNLLPIPILDGGHLFYYMIEMVTGKPVSERIQVFGFKMGMLFLIFLMAVAFYNDIIRLF